MTIGTGSILHDRFTVERQLGRGGMSAVWLAIDKETKQRVALKVLHPEVRKRAGMVRRFELEAKLLQALDHPGIARALGFFSDEQHATLAMEYVDGVTLEAWLAKRTLAGSLLPLDDAARVIDQIAEIVEYAHDKSIVHRDLKPLNIMLVASTGAIKVLDFGIAKILDADPHDATTQGRRIGTPHYMSPEQTLGNPADERADIFALGSILFELLTSRRAWLVNNKGELLAAFADDLPDPKANTMMEIFARIRSAPRPQPSDYRLGISPSIDSVVKMALAVEAKDRFASVREFRSQAKKSLRAKKRAQPVTPLLLSMSTICAVVFSVLALLSGAPAEVKTAPRPAERVEQPRPQPRLEPREPIAADIVEEESPIAIEAPVEIEKPVLRKVRPAEARPPKIDPLALLMAEARAKPTELSRLEKLSREIIRAADRIPDEAKKKRIRRIAESSALAGDVDGLEAALEELRREVRP